MTATQQKTRKEPKPKKCKICRTEFKPFQSTQKVCSVKCAIELTELDKTRKERQEIRKRKEALKTRSDYEKEAQEACNAYIRARDKDENCISCGRPPKKRNAGHYRSVGACPELRFHPFNIHLQCEHCNSWKSGNIVEYRIRLVKKIGLQNVDWLEGPHEIQHRTIEDLKEIKAYYKALTKQLETENVLD